MPSQSDITVPYSAASRTPDEVLRSYMEEALRPAAWYRQLGYAAAGAGLLAALLWVTWDQPVLATLIIGTIALHELGHLVAAMALGVRQRAGVWLTDALEPVAGWREALIALAGPVPGLLVAAGLMFGYVRGGVGVQPAEVAYVLALYNGLNLLPFFPLDGGRVLHAIFFARHPWVEVAFRLFSVFGVGLGAFLIGRLWLAVFAAIPFLALRSSFALGLQAKILRARRGEAAPSDLEIQAGVLRAFPHERRPAVLAKRALRLRSLAALPPDPALARVAITLGYAAAAGTAILVIRFPSLLG